MSNTKEQQWQVFARRAARVSKALWPASIKRSIATGRVAQLRRRLIVTCKYGRWSSLFPTEFKAERRPQGAPHSPEDFFLSSDSDGGVRGRPQGAPPIILSTPALTMNAVGATVLVGASIVILLAMRLWLLCLFFSMVMVAIFVLLVIMRMRIARTKGLRQGAQRWSLPGVLGKAHFPNTPMPVEPPLVRVLETFDLSETNVEHFLDLPEGGNTGGYSLERWREAQTSLPRTIHK